MMLIRAHSLQYWGGSITDGLGICSTNGTCKFRAGEQWPRDLPFTADKQLKPNSTFVLAGGCALY
jgi:hypothetical protein